MWYGQGSHLTEWDTVPHDEQYKMYRLQSESSGTSAGNFNKLYREEKNKRGEDFVSIQGMETDYCTCWVHKTTSPDDTHP